MHLLLSARQAFGLPARSLPTPSTPVVHEHTRRRRRKREKKREETPGGEKSGGTGREAINERKPWCRGTFEEGGQARMRREKDGSMTTIAQVDLSEPSAAPGNGMIVDCRGFDRGIWLG